MPSLSDSALATAAARALETGTGLAEPDVLAVLRLPDEELPAALELAHQVRVRWCGPEVEVEGIVSVKTGGCPEDCHFCSQSGLFTSPVRAAWLDIPSLVAAAVETAATGATESCLVAAVGRPDERLMKTVREGGETLEQRAEFAAQLADLEPDEVPLNFLNPRPGTPFGDQPVMPAMEALKTVATFRLALPRTILRYAGGREITLGDLAGRGVLG